MAETKSSIGGSQRSIFRGSAGARLAGVAMLLLLGLALAGWIRRETWSRLRELQDEISAIESERFHLGLHARESVTRLDATLLLFELSGDTNHRVAFLQIASALSNRLERTSHLLETPEEQRLARQFSVEYKPYLSNAAEMVEKRVLPVRKETALQVNAVIQETSGKLRQTSEQLVEAQNKAWNEFFGEVAKDMAGLRRVLWISTVSLLIFAVLLAALAYGMFVAPLRAMLTKSQEILERHEKLASLGTLAAGVAHEIRNPLQAIKMRLFSFNRSLPPSLKENEDLTVISSEINRLEKIVKETLQFARPGEPEMAQVSAAELVEDVVHLLGGSLAKRGIDLRVQAQNGLLVRADRQQIQQVLINLVLNGAESIRGDGFVTVTARPDTSVIGGRMQDVIRIEVTDTGTGISPEIERRIFDPFFSTKESGTGLGLAIAARIVENHSGFILYSTTEGKGTTFTLVLPQLINHERPIAAH
jgi:signal transduction histidine kinase